MPDKKSRPEPSPELQKHIERSLKVIEGVNYYFREKTAFKDLTPNNAWSPDEVFNDGAFQRQFPDPATREAIRFAVRKKEEILGELPKQLLPHDAVKETAEKRAALLAETEGAKVKPKRLLEIATGLEEMGAKEQAIVAYTRAFEKGARQRKTIERLVQLRLDLGLGAQARSFLEGLAHAVESKVIEGVKPAWLSALLKRIPVTERPEIVVSSLEPKRPPAPQEKTAKELRRETINEWVEQFFRERQEAERIGAAFSIDDVRWNGQFFSDLEPRMKGDIREALNEDSRNDETGDELGEVLREVADEKGWSVLQRYDKKRLDHEQVALIEDMRNPPSATRGASGRGKREKGETLKPPLPEEEVRDALFHRFEQAGIYIARVEQVPLVPEITSDMTPEEQLIEAQETAEMISVNVEKPIEETEQWLDECLQRFREETQPIRASIKNATIEQCEQLLFEERPGVQWGKIEEIAERYDGLDHKTLRAIDSDIEHYGQQYATPRGFIEHWKDYVARILAKDEAIQKEVKSTLTLLHASAQERSNELKGVRGRGPRKELKEAALMEEIRGCGLDTSLSFDAWKEKEMGPVHEEFDGLTSAIEAEIRRADKDKCQTLLQGGPDSIHDRFLRVFPSERTQALLEKGERVAELLSRLQRSRLEPVSPDANPVRTREGWERYLERISDSFLQFVRDVGQERERLVQLTEQQLVRLERPDGGARIDYGLSDGRSLDLVRMSDEQVREKFAKFGLNPDEDPAEFRVRLDEQLTKARGVFERTSEWISATASLKEVEQILGLQGQPGDIANARAWFDALANPRKEFEQFLADVRALKPSNEDQDSHVISFWQDRLSAFDRHLREIGAELGILEQKVRHEAEERLRAGMAAGERTDAIARTTKDLIFEMKDKQRKYGHDPLDTLLARAEGLVLLDIGSPKNEELWKRGGFGERLELIEAGTYAQELFDMSTTSWEDRLRKIEKEIPAMFGALRHFAHDAGITEERLTEMQTTMTADRKREGNERFTYVALGGSMKRRHERFFAKRDIGEIKEDTLNKAMREYEQGVATLSQKASRLLERVPDSKRAQAQNVIEQWLEAADLLEGIRQYIDSRKHDAREDFVAGKKKDRKQAWEQAHGERTIPVGHWRARVEFLLQAMAKNGDKGPLSMLSLEVKAAMAEKDFDERWRRLRTIFFKIVETKGVSVPGMTREDAAGDARIPVRWDHVVYREPGARRDTHIHGWIQGIWQPGQPLVINEFDPLTQASTGLEKEIPEEFLRRVEYAAPKSLDGKVSIDLLRLAGVRVYDRPFPEIPGSRRNLYLVPPGEVEPGTVLAPNTGGTNGPGFTGAAHELTDRPKGRVLPDNGSAEWLFEEWNQLLKDGKPIPDDFFAQVSVDDLVLYVDHHTRSASKETSGTKYLYELLDAIGTFSKFTPAEKAALTQAVKFVTYEDNKSHPYYLGYWWEAGTEEVQLKGENWKKMAPRTILGLARFMTLDTLTKVYRKYGTSEETDVRYLTDDDLREFDLEAFSERQTELVRKAEKDFNEYIERGHVLWDTKYGPVFVFPNEMNESGQLDKRLLTEGISVIAAKMGVGAIMYWDHVRGTMFFSTTGNPIERIPDWMRGKLGDIEVLRGTMVIGKNMKTGLKDFVRTFLKGDDPVETKPGGVLERYMNPDDPSGEAAQRWRYKAERIKLENEPSRLWDTLPHLYGVPVPLEIKEHGGQSYIQIPEWWRITRKFGVERVQVECPAEFMETIARERWQRYYITPTEVYDDPVEGRRVVIARLEGACHDSGAARQLEGQVKELMADHYAIPEEQRERSERGDLRLAGDYWLPYYRQFWEDYLRQIEGGPGEGGQE